MNEEELAVQYMPLCRSLSHRYHRTHFGTDADHLYSEALLAMVLAIRSYDPERSQLQTHIEYRVKKAMADYNRTYSGSRGVAPTAPNTVSLDRSHNTAMDDIRLDTARISLRMLLNAVEGRSSASARRVAAFELAHEGFTLVEIAERYGVCGARITQILAELASEIRGVVKGARK